MIPESVLKEIEKIADKHFAFIAEQGAYIAGSTDMYERTEKQIQSKDEEIKRLREALQREYKNRSFLDESGM